MSQMYSDDSQVLQASALMQDSSNLTSCLSLCGENWCAAKSMALIDGIELVYWYADFKTPIEFPIHDDAGRVCFSFNSQLNGTASCFYDDGSMAYPVEHNTGCIHYGPGRQACYRQHGLARGLSVTVQPGLLSEHSCSDVGLLENLEQAGGYLNGYGSSELFALTRMLEIELSKKDRDICRHPLWFQGQVLTFVSLMLEALDKGHSDVKSAQETQRIYSARDNLLADLSKAPNLFQLANEAGMSVSTLTRGFRRQFGISPYQLFQQERMFTARRLLRNGEASVTSVAIDLGYTNVGHFSSAFRKQFGLLPSDLLKH